MKNKNIIRLGKYKVINHIVKRFPDGDKEMVDKGTEIIVEKFSENKNYVKTNSKLGWIPVEWFKKSRGLLELIK